MEKPFLPEALKKQDFIPYDDVDILGTSIDKEVLGIFIQQVQAKNSHA